MAKKVDKTKRKRKPKPTQLNQFVGSKRQRKSKPDKTQLKTIYKLMLTAIPEARINQLIAAVHWYDAALDWIKDNEKKNLKLQTTSKVKILESIENIRAMSLSVTSFTKKEDLLKRLIQKFEQLFSGVIRTKSLNSTYSRLNKIQTRLEKRANRLEAKYQMVIGFLEEGLSPKNYKGESVSFKVGDLNKPRTVSADLRTFLYSKEHAQQILASYKKDGLLPIAIAELQWLSHVCSHRPNEEEKGKFIVDVHRPPIVILEMLNNLIAYCRSNPKIARRLVKTRRRKRRG